MRTLLATHLMPYPPDTGGKAVTWQTLLCLAHLGSVDVCAFVAPWDRSDGVARVEQVAGKVVTLPLERRPRALHLPLLAARGRPYYIMRDYSEAMRARIQVMAEDGYDLVVADSLYMAPYVVDLRIPKVLQEHNAESHLVREYLARERGLVSSWAGRSELRNLEMFERDQCNAFDAVLALSDGDRAWLRALGVRAPIMVIPPAVEPAEAVPDGQDRRTVVYLGTHHWPPIADGLRWYLREVHPHVRQAMPDSETVLAGARPPRDIQAADGRNGVRVLGYVEDPEPVYRDAAVFMVPLRIGGGVRLKILHALARGLAVVSTAVGCEGLGLQQDRHLKVADDPREFASAIVTLLRDPGLRQRLGTEGRSHVLRHFSPERRCARIEILAQAVLRKTRAQLTLDRTAESAGVT